MSTYYDHAVSVLYTTHLYTSTSTSHRVTVMVVFNAFPVQKVVM